MYNASHYLNMAHHKQFNCMPYSSHCFSHILQQKSKLLVSAQATELCPPHMSE